MTIAKSSSFRSNELVLARRFVRPHCIGAAQEPLRCFNLISSFVSSREWSAEQSIAKCDVVLLVDARQNRLDEDGVGILPTSRSGTAIVSPSETRTLQVTTAPPRRQSDGREGGRLSAKTLFLRFSLWQFIDFIRCHADLDGVADAVELAVRDGNYVAAKA